MSNASDSAFNVFPVLKRAQKSILIAAAILGAISMYMTFSFGWTWGGPIWAFALAAVSFGACSLPVLIVMSHLRSWKLLAHAVTIFWVAFFSIDAVTQIGFSAATREDDKNRTLLQNTKYEDARSKVKEAKHLLGVFKKQLATLMEKDAWVATVTASGLREQVKDLRVARESESKLGGCGQKCRAIENQIVEVKGQIAKAEQRENLDARIKATQTLIAKYSDQANKVEKVVSYGQVQTEHLAKVSMGFSLTSTPEWNQRVEMILKTVIGVMITLGAAVFAVLGLIEWHRVEDGKPSTPNPIGISSPLDALSSSASGDAHVVGLPKFLQRGQEAASKASATVLPKFDSFHNRLQQLRGA